MRKSAQSSQAATVSPAVDPELEKRVGRGAALLTASKLWFLVSGYVIELVLPRVFAHQAGDVEGKRLYGAYGVAVGLAAILNALVYQGTSQAVARFVGRAPHELTAVRRAAFKLQGLIVGGLFASLFLLAPWIASAIYDEAWLARPIRYAAFILLAFGFYAVTMGTLTGRQLFKRQALIDVSYSTLKVVCITGAAIALGKVLGSVESAVFGFALASVLVLVVSLAAAPREPLQGHLGVGELMRFQIFTMVFNLGVTMVAKMDLQLLQALTGDLAASGEYKAAQLLGTIPYQAVFAITFVLFPLVSGSAARDPERLRGYIRETTRYALIIAALITVCFAAAPARAVTLLYQASYAPAGAALRVLVLGYLAFSVFYIMTAVLTAAGKPHVSLLLVVGLVAIQCALGAVLTPRFGAVGIAAATAIAMVVGLVAANAALRRSFGAGIDLGNAGRVVLAAAAAAMIPHLLLDSTTVLGRAGFLAGVGSSPMSQRLVTVIVFGVAVVAFIALLFVTGAMGKQDADRFRRVFARGRQDASRP